jgi:hypothetical protein
MIEHEPWRGRNRKSGIEGQRIAIIGYSHHRNPKHVDHDQFTNYVLRNVLSGRQKGDSLFATVPGYFGYEDRAKLWNRVWFFNFIPECIGTSDKMYAAGTSDQNERARKRFERILRKEKPNKVFVFTTKGWTNCPPTDQEKRGEKCARLDVAFEDVSWGEYTFGGHTVLAFGLRHPLFANKAHMRAAVKKALSIS